MFSDEEVTEIESRVERMIYVIGEVNSDGSMSPFVKVGFVNGGESTFMERVKRRVNKLQVGNPRRMVVIGKTDGDRKLEKELHRMFQSSRVRRPIVTEWLELREGDAFSAWVDSVRIDTLTFGHAVGVGSRGGLAYVKGSSRCSECGSVEHSIARCPSRRMARIKELEAEVAELRTRIRTPASASESPWTWRGRTRAA